MTEADVTSLIERFTDFEQRCGVRIDNIFVSFNRDTGYVTINGEIYPLKQGGGLDCNIELIVSAHDSAGRVLEHTSTCINAESFYGFESFSLVIDVGNKPDMAKIKIYPKKNV